MGPGISHPSQTRHPFLTFPPLFPPVSLKVEDGIDRPVHLKGGMDMPTKLELADRITELEGENQTLNDKLDSIFDIATANGESDDEEPDTDDTTAADELSAPAGDEIPGIDLSDDDDDRSMPGISHPSQTRHPF